MSESDDDQDDQDDKAVSCDSITSENTEIGCNQIKNTLSEITQDLNNLTIVSPSSSMSTCTLKKCDLPKTEHMLECCKCKNLTHYGCTKLPAYQLTLFLVKGYRLYRCSSCAGEIQEELIKHCERTDKARSDHG